MKIKIEKFEGPLSLLLKMIEQEELDITEINLAGIADQYIEYIKNNNNISPDNMADFLVIAAKLLFIKSKALLPYIYAEEEEDLEDLEKAERARCIRPDVHPACSPVFLLGLVWDPAR